MDFFSVFQAAQGFAIGAILFNARADINRQRLATRAYLQDAIAHVCRCKPTRQDEVSVDAWRKE